MIIAPSLLDLIVPAPIIEVDERHLSLDERFDLFVQRNPHVVARLEAMTAEVVARGVRRIGIKTLLEALRWHYLISTDDPSSGFKINNSYGSRFARLLMDRHPCWDGLFETRELRS